MTTVKKSENKHSFYAEEDIQENLRALLENEPPRAKSRIINDLMRAGLPAVLKEIRAKRRQELDRIDALSKRNQSNR